MAEARSITSSAESRRRRIGPVALPWLHRLRKSSVLGEHSWKRFATSSEDWGLCGVSWWSDREGRGEGYFMKVIGKLIIAVTTVAITTSATGYFFNLDTFLQAAIFIFSFMKKAP